MDTRIKCEYEKHMDLLITIFLEAAHHASIIPLASEAAIYALKSFGGTDMNLPVALAVLGGLCGHLFNLLVGRLAMRLPSSPRNEPIYLKLCQHFNRYGFLLLVFCFVPLGNMLVIAAGMLGTPMKKALPAIAAGLVFNYGQLLLG